MADKEEMDVLLNEQVDPVSGNVAPLGAKPEEVRDDIEINVSPNEFVIDAATLRYFGEDFFKGLQDAAEDGWERLKGEAEGTPADDMEDALEEAEDEPTGLGARKGFADGGNTTDARIEEALNAPRTNTAIPQPSGGGYGGYGGTGAGFGGFESQVYVNTETGQRVVIYMFNGKPMRRIPEGFIPEDQVESVTEEDVAEALGDEAIEDVVSGPITETSQYQSLQAPESDYNKKPVDTWTMDDYDAYRQDMEEYNNNPLAAKIENGIIKFIGGLIGGPIGATALSSFVKNGKNKQAEAVVTQINSILESGISPTTGESLTGADISSLNNTRINANYLQSSLAEPNTILGFNVPFSSVGDGVDATQIMEQQQSAITAARTEMEANVASGMSVDDAKRNTMYYTPVGDTPSTFYGGTSATESSLIQSDLSDEDFWSEFEAGTPSGAGATFAAQEDEEDTSYKPKFDVTSGSLGANKNLENVLTEGEQRQFDRAVSRGNDALANHFEIVNLHRQLGRDDPNSSYYVPPEEREEE